MALFRRRNTTENSDPPPASPASPPPESIPSAGVPLPSTTPTSGSSQRQTEFVVGAVFSILGQGVVVAGTVRAGILKVGMRLQVERGAVGAIPGLAVEVRKIIPHVPHSTELYRGQYAKEVAEAGPGVQLGVSVAGTSQKDLKAGDLLFA